MEQGVTPYWSNHWLDLRGAFRPVPGLGVSHMQFPMAHAMGYFLSPSGLDVGGKSQVTATENCACLYSLKTWRLSIRPTAFSGRLGFRG
jgi:hypothetical protein